MCLGLWGGEGILLIYCCVRKAFSDVMFNLWLLTVKQSSAVTGSISVGFKTALCGYLFYFTVLKTAAFCGLAVFC